MRVTVHHEGFYDLHPLAKGEAAPRGAATRDLADGSTAIQFVRQEPNHTAFDYHGGGDLKADFAEYVEACNSVDRPLEYETEQEWLAMHVREVMKYHAPRRHFTAIGVDATREDEDEADVLVHAEHLRAAHGGLPAPDPDNHPVAEALSPEERRAAALAALGVSDFAPEDEA